MGLLQNQIRERVHAEQQAAAAIHLSHARLRYIKREATLQVLHEHAKGHVQTIDSLRELLCEVITVLRED